MQKMALFLTIVALCVGCGTQEDLGSGLWGGGGKGEEGFSKTINTTTIYLGSSISDPLAAKYFRVDFTPHTRVDLLFGGGQRWVYEQDGAFFVEGLLCGGATTSIQYKKAPTSENDLYDEHGMLLREPTESTCTETGCNSIAGSCSRNEVKVIARKCDIDGQNCGDIAPYYQEDCTFYGDGYWPCGHGCKFGRSCSDIGQR